MAHSEKIGCEVVHKCVERFESDVYQITMTYNEYLRWKGYSLRE